MRIWGFDLGTTSIGFAIIEHDEERRTGSILRLGVRIFPEGRDKDLEPKNKTRRAKRLARRQFRRRRLRRRLLNEALNEVGLLPRFGSEQWRGVMALDPYALRAKALTAPLTPVELGRTIYHQTKRRHFRDRDYGVDDEEHVDKKDPDEQKTKEGREALVHALKTSAETLGQYLAGRERKRGHHATRSVVDEEFDLIWAAQSAHHETLRDPAFRSRIKSIVFSQRPTFWRLSTLRSCPLEPGEPCPRGYWLSQQRRMLEIVNNLGFVGGNARPLTLDEREAILDALAGKESLSFGEARKALRSLWQRNGDEPLKTKFNLETSKGDDKVSKLKGNKVDAEIAAALGERWAEHHQLERLRKELPARIWEADYQRIGNKRVEIRTEPERRKFRAELVQTFCQEFDITDVQATTLAQMTLPTGWDRFSAPAIERMLPSLESGERMGTLLSSTDPKWIRWREETFPRRERPTGEILDKLPSRSDLMPQVRNPTVTRVLNELRKVVNNLLDLYDGRKPDLIRIELARHVGKPKKVREAIENANRNRERDRKMAIKELEENKANPSEENITKWLLWRECSKRCPYTGKCIGFDDLFSRGEFDIEHIWPRSISFDNSWTNKTLCHREENIRKGNRIPYDVYSHDEDKWNELKHRLESIGLPESKIKRFLASEVPEAFSSRQLNDTGWAARATRDFIARLWPDEGPEKPAPVQATNGRITAQLRRRWSLNHLLGDTGEKNRADHRHHAVDALAVACTTPGFVKRLSDYYKAEEEGRKPDLPKPWPTIREDAAHALTGIVVSYRVQRKLSGSLHEERPLGLMKKKAESPDGLVLARRKPLQDISDSEIDYIGDVKIRRLVEEQAPTKQARKALSSVGLRLPDRGNPDGRPVKKIRLHLERQPGAVKEINPPTPMNGSLPGQPYVELGQSLRHIALYRRPDGTIDYTTETRLQALKNVRNHKVPVVSKSVDGNELVCSLCSGDILARKAPDDRVEYLVVRKVNQAGRVFYKPVTQADTPKPEVSFGTASFADGALTKVSVDPIGRVRPARD